MQLDQEILTLRSLLDAGERAGCARALTVLRDRYRQQPSSFDPGSIQALRDIAEALKTVPALRNLRESPPDLAGQLKGVFGYDTFRAGQEEVIRAVLAGRDCLAVMPTGAGKSPPISCPLVCSGEPPWSSPRSSR
jgi:ATP-dependent DNA helicase RecQ